MTGANIAAHYPVAPLPPLLRVSKYKTVNPGQIRYISHSEQSIEISFDDNRWLCIRHDDLTQDARAYFGVGLGADV